jgi:GNAT superfamily N-acetyltransferase
MGDGAVRSVLYDNADVFADDCYGFLSNSEHLEMENNLSLGLLERLQNKEYENPYMLAVKNSAGAVSLTALLTEPYNLVLAKGDEKAIPILIEGLRNGGIIFPGILGPADIADNFAVEWNAYNEPSLRPFLTLLFYAVTNVKMPENPSGFFRSATEDDISWMEDWLVQFAIDAGLSEHEQRRNPEKTLKRIREKRLFVWEKNGSPVSIAGYVPLTKSGVRVHSVYTPPAERGNGYASACVASLSQYVLDNGIKWASLFADASNPTSNKIYKNVGYKQRCMYHEYKKT